MSFIGPPIHGSTILPADQPLQDRLDAALLDELRGRLGLRQPERPWPIALTFEDALAYTNLSPALLRAAIQRGDIPARRLAPRRGWLMLRAHVDRYLDQLFAPTCAPIEEDFDFG